MGRGKKRHHGLLAPVGSCRGQHVLLTAAANLGDECDRECPRHGLSVFVARSAGNNKRSCWRCRQCEKERVYKRQVARKKLLVLEAGDKCGSCGYSKYWGALHFHHRDPSKKSFGLSIGAMTTHSLERLREEAAKCDLLCGNCHTEVEATVIQDSKDVIDRFVPNGREDSSKLYGDCNIHGHIEFSKTRHNKEIRSECKRCRYERVLTWRRNSKETLVSAAGGKCLACGYNRYQGALHFHHRDPTAKVLSLGNSGCLALNRLLKEIQKCDLLCCNCHAEKHAKEIDSGLVDPTTYQIAESRL